MTDNIHKVLILGGGPAGLTAAWKLALAGKEVTVLEADDQVGGLSKSVRREGFTFDLGGHRFITHNMDLADDVQNLLGDQLSVRPRKSTIRLMGKFFKYPLDFGDLVKKLPILTQMHSGMDYVFTAISRKLKHYPDESLEDWVVNRFGRALYNIYFGPYSEKLWGVPAKTISADWAAQRISLPNLWDVFLRLLGKKADMPKTYATKFFYPIGGIGVISERLVEEIIIANPKKNKVILNAPVKRFVHDEKQVTEIVYEENGEEKSVSADFIINTIPLPNMIRFMDPPLEQSLIDVANQMKFRSLRFLNLMLDMEQVSDNTWMYIPEHKYYFFRIQEPKNWHPGNAPGGKTSLILEIACDYDDKRWTASDDETAEECFKSLNDLGWPLRDKASGWFSTFARYAYPIYTLDYKEKLRGAFKILNRFENLLCCGRQGLYRYNNMDHSMEMGILAARHVTEDIPREQIYSVATEGESFEQDHKQAYTSNSNM
jgi:protoporphyrinogen oxidase